MATNQSRFGGAPAMDQFAQEPSGPSRSLYRAVVQLCGNTLDKGAARANADHYVKNYPSRDFALSMIFFFIMGLDSLRQLQIHLAEDSRLTRLISMRGISIS